MILRSHIISNLDRIPELIDELLDLLFHDEDSDEGGVDSLVAIGIVPHTPEIHSIKSSSLHSFHFCCCDTPHSSAVAARLVRFSGAVLLASEWRQI